MTARQAAIDMGPKGEGSKRDRPADAVLVAELEFPPPEYLLAQASYEPNRKLLQDYSETTQLPIYEAIKGLPWLSGYTQIRAQISGAVGQNVAQPVAASERKDSAEIPVNWRGRAHLGAQ